MPDTSQEIMTRLMTDIDDKYDKSEGSFFYDAEKPVAIEAERLYAKIDSTIDRAFVQTATGIDIDNKLAEVGLTRISASYATGEVVISGNAGTPIPAGTQVKSDSLTFTISESGSISQSGSVTLPAVCNTAGPVGNIPPGAINDTITISIEDKVHHTIIFRICRVTNITAFSHGENIESDESARARYLKRAQRPPTSGNKYHYEEWALEASTAVGKSKCLPLWDNDSTHTPGEVAGNVTVLLLDNTMSPASTALVNTVKAYIDTQKPIGANVIVAAAEALAINVSLELTLAEGFDVDAVKENIKSAISKYLQGLAFEATEVSYAKIGSCVLSVEGVIDYENMTVNSGTVNIDIDYDEVPVMGVLTVAD